MVLMISNYWNLSFATLNDKLITAESALFGRLKFKLIKLSAEVFFEKKKNFTDKFVLLNFLKALEKY